MNEERLRFPSKGKGPGNKKQNGYILSKGTRE